MLFESCNPFRAHGRWLACAGALVAALTASGAFAAQSPLEAATFTSSPRGHVLVTVSVNGSEPMVFALDTGAGKTALTPETAEKLGLDDPNGEKHTLIGVHGKTQNQVVELRSVALGDAQVTGITAVVQSLDHITAGKWHADGILGMDFLSRFDVRLDFGASTVSLYVPASDRSDCAACPPGAEGIVYETVSPNFVVLPVTVDGKPVKAVLDTGSGHSGLNGKAAESLGVELPPIPAGFSPGHGLGLQAGPVRLGDATLAERANLHVMDHPVMESLGLADGPAMLMGTDQLSGRALTISYGLGLVFME